MRLRISSAVSTFCLVALVISACGEKRESNGDGDGDAPGTGGDEGLLEGAGGTPGPAGSGGHSSSGGSGAVDGTGGMTMGGAPGLEDPERYQAHLDDAELLCVPGEFNGLLNYDSTESDEQISVKRTVESVEVFPLGGAAEYDVFNAELPAQGSDDAGWLRLAYHGSLTTGDAWLPLAQVDPMAGLDGGCLRGAIRLNVDIEGVTYHVFAADEAYVLAADNCAGGTDGVWMTALTLGCAAVPEL